MALPILIKAGLASVATVIGIIMVFASFNKQEHEYQYEELYEESSPPYTREDDEKGYHIRKEHLEQRELELSDREEAAKKELEILKKKRQVAEREVKLKQMLKEIEEQKKELEKYE